MREEVKKAHFTSRRTSVRADEADTGAGVSRGGGGGAGGANSLDDVGLDDNAGNPCGTSSIRREDEACVSVTANTVSHHARGTKAKRHSVSTSAWHCGAAAIDANMREEGKAHFTSRRTSVRADEADTWAGGTAKISCCVHTQTPQTTKMWGTTTSTHDPQSTTSIWARGGAKDLTDCLDLPLA
jgi:hypothetical protein